MSEAARHDCRILLLDNAAECSAVAAHYLLMVPQYKDLNNHAGVKYSVKCAVLHVNAVLQSLRDIEALDAPPEINGGAE